MVCAGIGNTYNPFPFIFFFWLVPSHREPSFFSSVQTNSDQCNCNFSGSQIHIELRMSRSVARSYLEQKGLASKVNIDIGMCVVSVHCNSRSHVESIALSSHSLFQRWWLLSIHWHEIKWLNLIAECQAQQSELERGNGNIELAGFIFLLLHWLSVVSDYC